MEHINKRRRNSKATLVAASTQTPPSDKLQFKNFPQLPEDVRYQIWKHVMRQHRIIEVEAFSILKNRPRTRRTLYNPQRDVKILFTGDVTDDLVAISKLMFCQEPPGHAVERIQNNKALLEPPETIYFVSNLMSVCEQLYRTEHVNASFSASDNIRTLSFCVLKDINMVGSVINENVGQILKSFKSLEKIYLVLDIDKYLSVQKAPRTRRAFIPGCTGLVPPRSTAGPNTELYYDADTRRTLMEMYSHASRTKSKILEHGLDVKIFIVQWEL